jgi:hypothetical protein
LASKFVYTKVGIQDEDIREYDTKKKFWPNRNEVKGKWKRGNYTMRSFMNSNPHQISFEKSYKKQRDGRPREGGGPTARKRRGADRVWGGGGT